MTTVVTLDVSTLEPPQPLREICQALADLSQGELLQVSHRRKPVPLFDMLEPKFVYLHREIDETRHVIYIWYKDDIQTGKYVRTKIDENDGA